MDKVLYLFRAIMIEGEMHISIFVVGNNEFNKLGSFTKDSITNINKFYELLNKNDPVIIIKDYKYLMELYNHSIELSLYNSVFSKINRNNVLSDDTNIFEIDNTFSNLQYKTERDTSDLEYNLIIDYIIYLEQMYLLDYYKPKEYIEKMNIFYYKLQDKLEIGNEIFEYIKKRM